MKLTYVGSRRLGTRGRACQAATASSLRITGLRAPSTASWTLVLLLTELALAGGAAGGPCAAGGAGGGAGAVLLLLV